MTEHIKSLSGKCVGQLRRLKLIKKSLNKTTTHSLVHALIHSQLDYCNSLFYGLPNKSIAMLQSIQNRAAKIIVGALKYDQVTPILIDLHWLSIDKRIIYIIQDCMLVYKCMNELAPAYIIDECVSKTTSFQRCHMQSKDLNFIVVSPKQL